MVHFDLTGHETARRAAMMEAVGDTYDPVTMLEDEAAAWTMLYSSLDADQQAMYDYLVEVGVLPGKPCSL